MTLKEFKQSQFNQVQANKKTNKINPITGWIDSVYLETGYIRKKEYDKQNRYHPIQNDYKL